MTNKAFVFFASIAVAVVAFASIGVYETFLDDDVVEVSQPALIPGNSFSESVGASEAEKIQGSAYQVSYQCTVDSAYAGTLYIGGPNVSSSLYRRTATGGDVFQADLRWEWALSSSGSATLYCGESIR